MTDTSGGKGSCEHNKYNSERCEPCVSSNYSTKYASISELTRRLENIEQKTSKTDNEQRETNETNENNENKEFKPVLKPKFLDIVEKHTHEEKIKTIENVKNIYKREITKKDVNNFFVVIDFTIEFVEKLIIIVPKIVEVVGGVFEGKFKLNMAIELLCEIFPNIDSILPDNLLPGLINHTVEIKYNNQKNNDGTTSNDAEKNISKTTETSYPNQVSIKKKKKFF